MDVNKALALLLGVSILMSLFLPYVTRSYSVDKPLEVTEGTVRLKYQYIYLITIDGLAEAPVQMAVVQHYLVVVSDYNSTHVQVDSSPVENSSVTFLSGSWVAIAAMIAWAGNNLTNFLQKIIIPSINKAIIPKDKVDETLRAIMHVSPFKEIKDTGSCIDYRVGDNMFTAKLMDIGVSGSGAYDCRAGILLSYNETSKSRIPTDNGYLDLSTRITVELESANEDLLKYIIVGPAENPAQPAFPIEWLVVGIAAGLMIVALALFLKTYKRTRHQA